MMRAAMRRAAVAAVVACAVAVAAGQEESGKTVFRAQTNVVLAPALVMTRSGEIVRGLTARDFVVEENGVEQVVKLDESPEAQGLSLVVAVQRGRSANLEIEGIESAAALAAKSAGGVKKRKKKEASLSGLAAMVENFVGDSRSEVAIVSFDSTEDVLQRFTTDMGAALDSLGDLTASGDKGAAILDAVSFSVDMLERRPKGRTRVLLLICEERDHGSVSKLDDVVRKVAHSDVLIYSVSFSPLRSETIRDWKEPGTKGPNFLKLLGLAGDAMARNSARAVAELTGGEYNHFTSKKNFDDELGTLANHVRGRYLLSFVPTDTTPGAHRFTVRLRGGNKDAVVVARNSYWAEGK